MDTSSYRPLNWCRRGCCYSDGFVFGTLSDNVIYPFWSKGWSTPVQFIISVDYCIYLIALHCWVEYVLMKNNAFMICGLLYHYYWVRVTPIPDESLLLLWRNNSWRAGPRKQHWVDPALGPAAFGPCQPVAATSCLVQPGPKTRTLFLKLCPYMI